MYRVVTERERWFNIVMGDKYSIDAASTDKYAERIPFPEELAKELSFNLEVKQMNISRQLQAGFYSDVLLTAIRKHYKDNAVDVTMELLKSLSFFETDLAPRIEISLFNY